jgi:hypothetical protein
MAGHVANVSGALAVNEMYASVVSEPPIALGKRAFDATTGTPLGFVVPSSKLATPLDDVAGSVTVPP